MAIQPAVRNNEYFRALECAITQEYMNDPVIDPCGHTYEKEKIKEWLQEHETCPLSGKHVNARSLIPNLMVHDITNELQGGLELRITAVIQQEIDHIKGGIRSEYRLYIKELR
ncbi:MAG: U-box domain-containing protein, partial [Rhabdochlamydiaceae bacterium]